MLCFTICAVSIGASTALAMNELSKAATPYDLNVLSNVSTDGDSNISEYLATHDVAMRDYAENMEQKCKMGSCVSKYRRHMAPPNWHGCRNRCDCYNCSCG